MQVRKATEADIPGILGMAERFYRATEYATDADYDAASMEAMARLMMDSGVLLVADDNGLTGMVGLVVAPFMFNSAHLAAYEVVWWVNPEARGGMTGARLLKAVEPACKERGCTRVTMAHMADSPPQAGQLYARYGYRHTETSWTKVISNGSNHGGGHHGRHGGVLRQPAEESG